MIYSYYVLKTAISFEISVPTMQEFRKRIEKTLVKYPYLAALLAMKVFRHKTMHFRFKYGIPLILLLQIAGVIYLHWPK